MDYQERIVVGRGRSSQVYILLQDHYFVEFHPETTSRQITRFLRQHGLEPLELP